MTNKNYELVEQSLFMNNLKEMYPNSSIKIVPIENNVFIYIFRRNPKEYNEVSIDITFVCRVRYKGNNLYQLNFFDDYNKNYCEIIDAKKTNKQYKKL